ncbi:MAG: TonB-dependent receptor, partial [Proteobacteria bacterium]
HSEWESPIATQTVVIDDEKLQHYSNVAELLTAAPGIDLVNGIRGQNIRLDGLDSKYTLVLIDGQRVSGKLGEAYDFRALELSGVHRIEIIRGAGSALYGSDAIGGVINIITRDTVKQRVRVHADSNKQRDVSLSTGLVGEQSSVAVDIFAHQAEPINVPGSVATRFSGSEKFAVQIEPRWRGEKWDVKGRLHGSQEKLEATELSAAGAIFKRYNDLSVYSVGTDATRYFEADARLQMSVKAEQNKDDYEQTLRRTGATQLREKTDERFLESNVSYVAPIGKHLINIGAQHINEELSSDRLKDDSVERGRAAVYLQDELRLLDDSLTLIPAIRQDQDTQYDGHTSGKLALRYAPDKNQAFLISYGEGYRAPSFKELYLLFENTSVGYVVEGNDALKPETSRSVHAQYNIRSSAGWNASIGAYHYSIKDMIENLLILQEPTGLIHYSYTNISAAETLGADLNIAMDLGKAWTLNLGYGFLQARDLSRQSALVGRSKHALSYQAQYSFDAFSVSSRLKWQSARTASSDAGFGNDEAIVIGDLIFNYRRGKTFIYSLAIENLGGSSGDMYW